MADALLVILGFLLLIVGVAHHVARRPLWVDGSRVASVLILVLLLLGVSIVVARHRPPVEWVPVILAGGLLFLAARMVRAASLILGIAREPFLAAVREVLRQDELDSVARREIRIDHRPIGVGGIVGPSAEVTAQFAALLRERLEASPCGRNRGFILFTVLTGLGILVLSSLRL
jgi:hypothetical protein